MHRRRVALKHHTIAVKRNPVALDDIGDSMHDIGASVDRIGDSMHDIGASVDRIGDSVHEIGVAVDGNASRR